MPAKILILLFKKWFLDWVRGQQKSFLKRGKERSKSFDVPSFYREPPHRVHFLSIIVPLLWNDLNFMILKHWIPITLSLPALRRKAFLKSARDPQLNANAKKAVLCAAHTPDTADNKSQGDFGKSLSECGWFYQHFEAADCLTKTSYASYNASLCGNVE